MRVGAGRARLLRAFLCGGLAIVLVAPAASASVTSKGQGPLESIVVRLAAPGSTLGSVTRSVAASVVASVQSELPLNRAVFRVAQSQVAQTLTKLRADPRVVYATQGHIWRASALPNTPNDPAYPKQANLAAIKAAGAWAVTHGNASVPVAVLDTGVDMTHPDLSGKIVGGKTICPAPACTTTWDKDAFGHGTHVAGIVAAATDNAVGIAGTGWDTTVRMYKVLDDTGAGSSVDVATGIIAATNDGAKVINLSLGSASCQADPFACGSDPDTASAVSYAQQHGVVLVAAAGNALTGKNPDSGATFPAAYPGVVSVAAADNIRAVAPFSQFGSWVTMAAPGIDILSTLPSTSTLASYCTSTTQPPNGYEMCSGTSMASPEVAAAAALILAKNPTWTASQVVSQLVRTAQPVTGGNPICGGFLDMTAALTTLPSTSAPAWSCWRPLATPTASSTATGIAPAMVGAPAVASWQPGRVDLFGTFIDGRVWHDWSTDSYASTDNNWQILGAPPGGVNASPAAVAWGPNRLDVFVRGGDNALWHAWWDGISWNGWQNLGGYLTSAPVVSSWAPGRLDVFVKGGGQEIWHKWWDGSNWLGWENRGGIGQFDPAAVSWGPNRVDLFTVSTDSRLWHQYWDGASWSPWLQELPGTFSSGPAASSWSTGRLDVFAESSSSGNSMAHAYWGGFGWGSDSLGQQLTTAPGAVSWAPSRIDTFILSQADGHLWHKYFGVP